MSMRNFIQIVGDAATVPASPTLVEFNFLKSLNPFRKAAPPGQPTDERDYDYLRPDAPVFANDLVPKPFGRKQSAPTAVKPAASPAVKPAASPPPSSSITSAFNMLDAIKKHSPSDYDLLMTQIRKEYARLSRPAQVREPSLN